MVAFFFCTDTYFSNSSAFVITFVVNNHVDPEMNKPAEAWGKALADLISTYNHSEGMTIAHSTEVRR